MRFGSIERSELGSIERSELFKAKLKTKVKGKHETLSELAQAIKKLTRQAYPRADTNMTNTLALDHFIDAIPDKEMKLRIREARPRNIEEAEMFAVRLETYKLADQPHIETTSPQHVNRITLILNVQNSKHSDTVISCLKDIKESLDTYFTTIKNGIERIPTQTKPNRNQSYSVIIAMGITTNIIITIVTDITTEMETGSKVGQIRQILATTDKTRMASRTTMHKHNHREIGTCQAGGSGLDTNKGKILYRKF